MPEFRAGDRVRIKFSADIAATAEAAGLEYHYLPITAMTFPGPDFDRMSAEIRRFMRPLAGRIAIVRPDRIIMDACRSEGLEAATDQCRRALAIT